ncbi:hypothetical protein ACOSP7_001389 [Xanthoceras sorbifolium]
MKFSQKAMYTLTLILFILLISTTRAVVAFRPLKVEKARGDRNLVSVPLNRNPVPPYGSSPCTYIPSPGGNCHNNRGNHP